MAILQDPDFLNQGVEVTIDTTGKQLMLNTLGNLTTDGVTLQCLYSWLKEEWKNDNTLIKYEFPMEAITSEQFELINGWNFSGQSTRNLVRGGGWALRNIGGTVLEEYMNITTLGGFYAVGDTAYYQQSSSGAASGAPFTGPVDLAIKIYDTGGVSGLGNRRSYFKIFLREQGETYDDYNLITEQSLSSLTYRKYGVPLSNNADINIATPDAFIATGASYTGISGTFYTGSVSRTIGSSGYRFNIIIDAKNNDLDYVYEKCQYLLRQNVNINSGWNIQASTGLYTGKLTRGLVSFVGETLTCESGVFIDNIPVADINNISFVDISGNSLTFPYVAAGAISFGTNLQTDASAKYWLFFTSVPSGNFGTSGAVIVKDNNTNNISGLVNAQSSVAFSFDYDGNVQGGRTAQSDAPVTAIAIGLSGAQYVSATATIGRSNANAVSLTAAKERNYLNT
jgi:hypothetical protein